MYLRSHPRQSKMKCTYISVKMGHFRTMKKKNFDFNYVFRKFQKRKNPHKNLDGYNLDLNCKKGYILDKIPLSGNQSTKFNEIDNYGKENNFYQIYNGIRSERAQNNRPGRSLRSFTQLLLFWGISSSIGQLLKLMVQLCRELCSEIEA